MIKYLKRFWSECFDGDVPTPYAQLHLYMITLFSGLICSIVGISIFVIGSIFFDQVDPLVFVLLLIGIGNTILAMILLLGLHSRYTDSDFEPNKN